MQILEECKSLNMQIKIEAVVVLLLILMALFIKRMSARRKSKKLAISAAAIEKAKLLSIQQETAVANDKLTSIQSAIAHEKKQLDYWKSLAAKQKADAAAASYQTPLNTSSSTSTSSSSSGVYEEVKTEPVVEKPSLSYTKVLWSEVNNYLYTITEWGEPSVHSYDADNILVPWATDSEQEFTVGGIDYTWGRMDDEESNDYTNWWSYLSYEHPVIGSITIINKLDEDANHIFRNDDGDTELSSGELSDLRPDQERAVKQGMTALYIWLKSRE